AAAVGGREVVPACPHGNRKRDGVDGERLAGGAWNELVQKRRGGGARRRSSRAAEVGVTPDPFHNEVSGRELGGGGSGGDGQRKRGQQGEASGFHESPPAAQDGKTCRSASLQRGWQAVR